MGGIGNGDASVGAPVAIRVATADDAQAIAGIYRPYVQETAVTFECTAPGEDEMRHCGSKFGRWYSIAWIQKDIGPHGPAPQPISAFRP